jgi:hypothetical protein
MDSEMRVAGRLAAAEEEDPDKPDKPDEPEEKDDTLPVEDSDFLLMSSSLFYGATTKEVILDSGCERMITSTREDFEDKEHKLEIDKATGSFQW